MGKPTGFMDYERETAKAESPLERIKPKKNSASRRQDVWHAGYHSARQV